MKIKSFAIILLLITSLQSHATLYYVNNSATGNGNGLTWTNAFTDLQSALSISVFGDEIWVATGNYKATNTTDRTVSFVLKDGVNIYGGFAGNENSISQRDIPNNPTTLNGDIGQTGDYLDNTYNIIRGINLTSTIILDGFRIINGYSSGSYNGGAINLSNSVNGTLTIKNCYFYSNRAVSYGGAICLKSSKLIIDNSEFRNNQTVNGGDGGAIYTGTSGNGISTLIIKGTKFIGNYSYSGACLANTGSYQDLIIDRCIFTNNTSEGSIIDIEYFTTAKILNSYIIGNTINDWSPSVLYVYLSASSSAGDFELVNCTIAHNFNLSTTPIQHEIIRLTRPDFKVRNCIIYGNTQYSGRQINTGITVSNSLIEGGYTGGSNIIDLNPQFVNPATLLNTNFDAVPFDYSLNPNSPAINAGNNSFVDSLYLLDLNNYDRIQGTIVDLGCYESDVSVKIDEHSGYDDSKYFFDYNNSSLIFRDNETFIKKELYVFDICGRLIYKLCMEDQKIKLDLETGIYIVKTGDNKIIKIFVP